MTWTRWALPWGRAKSWPSASLLCLPGRRPQADSRRGPQRSGSGGVPWGHWESCSAALRQNDPDATEFIQELAEAKPKDLHKGVEVGVGDLFAGLRPQDVLARKAVRPERAKIVDAQHDAPGLAGHLRAHEKRHRARGHVGRQASGRAAIWRWASGTW